MSAGHESASVVPVWVKLGAFGFVWLLLITGCGQAEQAQPAEQRDPLSVNRACESCHVEIAEEWRGSQHHHAADFVFRAALRRDPLRFCEGCHAPAAPTSRAVSGALGELGVGCVSCHAAAHGDAPANVSPQHPPVSVRSGVNACASCHEFAFPNQAAPAEAMQSTVSEQQRSSYRGAGCVGCHMPNVQAKAGSHRSHAFAASRSSEALRAALHVTATRHGNALRLELWSRGVGHAYPTGDLFRRLAIRAEARGDDYAVGARAQRFLARHFKDQRVAGRSQRRAVSDDRLLPGVPLQVELELGRGASGLPIAYEVRLERVLHMNPDFEADAQVESDELLASGSVPVSVEEAP